MPDLTPVADLPPSAEIASRLESLLRDREMVLRELEPRALPTVDPVAYQTAGSHRAVIRQLTDALERVAAGTYGLCGRCGEPIAPARLEVLPQASACIECQSLVDAA